jgi:hypothetical protein
MSQAWRCKFSAHWGARNRSLENFHEEFADTWREAAGVASGPVFRTIDKAGKVGGKGFSPKVIWGVVLKTVAPHNLRRTCARLCHEAAANLNKSNSSSVT